MGVGEGEGAGYGQRGVPLAGVGARPWFDAAGLPAQSRRQAPAPAAVSADATSSARNT